MRRLPATAHVIALTERLVATPSVCGDVAAERACAAVIEALLPASLPHGTWRTADGRPVPWVHLAGRTSRTTLLLGHYDTVGADEFRRLDPDDATLAFAPRRVRDALLAAGDALSLTPDQHEALAEERRAPGTWMFGRGALDMKGGIAASLAALHVLADGEPPEAGVLAVFCPDEEAGSAGMLAAVRALPGHAARHGLELAGALNVDFAEDAAAYVGAMGKVRVLLWVLGSPTHAGAPYAGVDAAQVAAELAAAAARDGSLVDRAGGRRGPPAVVLRLADQKRGYDVQTAGEAIVELNVMALERGVDASLAAVRAVVRRTLGTLGERMRALHAETRAGGPCHWPASADDWRVLGLEELGAAGAPPSPEDADADLAPADATEVALSELRGRAWRSGLPAPAVVIAALPPWYPAAAPGAGAFTRAVRDTLAREGVETRDYYPYITDACYAAHVSGANEALGRALPVALREPWASLPGLGLEVANLGPWGRDAHGLLERAHVGWTFERLPRLLVQVLEEVR